MSLLSKVRIPISGILYNEIGLKYLQRFATREHSEENLMFWLAVEKYRSSDEKVCVCECVCVFCVCVFCVCVLSMFCLHLA